ncbi:MAG: bifunctional riboflavin kinase/FAD synthetase [Candidatus Omnitrophica bacterium]|nr:bifunctional riboflavin kinase/FAD synthetase [Candidatus Omnitrophota bacterium]MDD5592316.1 bifunctional riboflavin kinase/FAD synthetase [Candidatus Omnitrophota bacterium]
MKIIYGINKIIKFRKPVVALGVFDGVHIGHQRILKAAVDKARRIKGTSIVVTFWPDPHKEKSLYSLEHRLRLIEGLGIDVCIVIKFNQKFSWISAEDFVKDILAKKIGAKHIYVGKNFRFGKQGRGDFKILTKLSGPCHFKLKVFELVKINNQSISSTYIRRLITAGRIDWARKLLFRPVSILGTVIKGSSLATRLGFPTANINPHHEVLPPAGIYAVCVILNHQCFKGVCYIGSKPTFKSGIEKHIEVYIFNFHRDIYGRYLEIQFIKKIRQEKKFNSWQSLANQVQKDIILTKGLFSHPDFYHKMCPS